MKPFNYKDVFRIVCTLGIVLSVLIAEKGTAQRLPKLIPYKAAADSWGYCDSTGRIRITPQFREAHLFHNGKAVVSLPGSGRNEFCVIDEQGMYVIPPAYHWDGYVSADRRYASLNVHDSANRWGSVGMDGQLILPFRYTATRTGYDLPQTPHFEHRDSWAPWFMITEQNGRKGIIDTLGQELIPFAYDEIVRPSQYGGLRGWMVRRDSAWGILRPNGLVLYPIRFQQIYPEYDKGWARVRAGGKMGVIDTAGQWMIPPRYDTIHYNNEDTAGGFHLAKGGRWGWANRSGKLILPTTYECCAYMQNGYLVAQVKGKGEYRAVLFDRHGRRLIPPGYTSISPFRDSIVADKYRGRKGDTTYYEISVLDSKTLRPLHRSRLVKHCFRLEKEYANWCGFSSQFFKSDRQYPYIDSAGNKIYQFNRDGLRWQVTGYVLKDSIPPGVYKPQSHVSVSAYNPATKRFVYAVMDQQRNYVIRPQDHYEIKGGSIPANWLIVYKDSTYAIADTMLCLLTKPVRRRPYAFFSRKGRPYMFAYTGLLDESDNDRYSPGCFRCNCTSVLDGDGNILKGFEPYCYPRFLAEDGSHLAGPSLDILSVTDSLGKVGFLHLDGRVHLPEISFRYKSVQRLAPQLFFVSNDKYSSNGMLINDHSKEYIPGLIIRHAGIAQNYSSFTGYRPVNEPLLLKVEYAAPGNSTSFFYMSLEGRIFADPKAL